MNYRFRILNIENKQTKNLVLLLFFMLFSLCAFSQIKSSVDSTSVKIGQEIIYKIEVETDSTNRVVFPEGQTFAPLEMIESYKTDTVKKDAKFQLIKKYGLTQFDSGRYYIPKQKVIIGDKIQVLDSLLVEINTVKIDTTKQKLYDIKPIINVKTPSSNWWKYVLIGLLIASAIGFILYWFIWREKPLTEEEKIALLPPYDRAQLALKNLDNSGYLEREAIKDYYSELTLAIRKYLDEKVYDRALESTTDELISKLNLLKDGNQIDLSKESLKNLESILKRADLVKFAKSAPDIELAKLDRKVVAEEIDHVKEALPEATEEEKLLDKAYKKEQERKKKRHKIIITIVIVLALITATFIGFGIKYGFNYTVDTIVQKDTKKLLEGEWITSDYGFPPIHLETPNVLKRTVVELPDNLKKNVKMALFSYELKEKFTIVASTTQFSKPQQNPQAPKQETPEIDIEQAVEGSLKQIEAKGGRNILSTNEKFTTPNGANGLKTAGTLELPIKEGSDVYVYGNFTILTFAANKDQVLQQVFMTYLKDDVYLKDIHERIINSLELKPKEDKNNN